MPSVTLRGGGKLAYRESGRGTPLLLIHGSPGEGRSWSRVAPHLAEHHRVLMPDLPGYGGSDPVVGDMPGQTARMGAAIAALIETCGEPVRLCGHSYGGNVALHAALTQADKVHSLALFEPVFFRALQLACDEGAYEGAVRFFSTYADRVTGGEPAAVGEMINYWFGPGAFAHMPATVQAFLTNGAPRNATDVRASLAEQLTAEEISGFAKPVLVAYGGASPPAAPAIAKALVGFMPSARLRTIPGATHGMLDSHPDAVAALILAD